MTKPELLERLTRNREDLFNALSELSEDQISTEGINAEWTTKDLIGHIAYWEQVVLDHVRETFTQGRPRPVSRKHPESKMNPREAKRRHGWKWPRVRAEFENTRAAVFARVQDLTEIQLGFIVPKPWWDQQNQFFSIAQMIEQDVLDHGKELLAQIQERFASRVH